MKLLEYGYMMLYAMPPHSFLHHLVWHAVTIKRNLGGHEVMKQSGKIRLLKMH